MKRALILLGTLLAVACTTDSPIEPPDNIRIDDSGSPPPPGPGYREDFNGTSVPSGWGATDGSWSVGGGVLTGRDLTSTNPAALVRSTGGGPPSIIRARLLNTAGQPWGAASIAFNWVSSTDYMNFSINTDDQGWAAPLTISAAIASTSGGSSQALATCLRTPQVVTNTFYVLELTDTPGGIEGRVLDQSGSTEICSMSVPGVRLTGSTFGLHPAWAGGSTVVDWIETN